MTLLREVTKAIHNLSVGDKVGIRAPMGCGFPLEAWKGKKIDLPWPENVWLGVTAEDNERLARVERLREVPAAVRFLSVEPFLDPLPDLDLAEIDWVIVDGESGPGARSMREEWVVAIRDSCVAQGYPSLQAGGHQLLSADGWHEGLEATVAANGDEVLV